MKNGVHVIRLSIFVFAAFLAAFHANADCTWTPSGTSIMYISPCNVGINQTSALWPLDVNGTIGVKGSPALIRPTSWADVDGLKFMGTQLALGQLNSRAYNYTGSAIAFIGGFYDGSELLRLASNTNNGLISVTQSSVDSLNVDLKNTLLHVVKSAPGSLGPEIKLENSGNAVNDSAAVTFADNGANRAQIRSTVENDPPNYRGTIQFFTGLGSLTEKMRITGDGKVGIGTGAPQFPLDVNGDIRTVVMPPDDTTEALSKLHFSNRGSGGGEYRWSFLMASPGPNGAYGVSPSGLELYEYPGPNDFHPTCCMPRLIIRKTSSATVAPAPFVIDGSGHVGIGVWSPSSYALDVSGTLHVSGNALFSGTVTGANIQANYQDVAEWVPASEAMTAGTVVVIDPAAVNGVKPSSRSYDTGVAGVVSAQPGVLLGQAGQAKEKIATTGRVKVRVRGPIAAGELLVTSDTAGVAMRSEPVDVAGIKMHRPGTLIGKALEPLKEGMGEILVLLSLQ